MLLDCRDPRVIPKGDRATEVSAVAPELVPEGLQVASIRDERS